MVLLFLLQYKLNQRNRQEQKRKYFFVEQLAKITSQKSYNKLINSIIRNNVLIIDRSHKIIKMDKANTLFYHGHILNNIQSLDKRKDGFIGHRLQFLNEYCSPVRNKIAAIKQDILHYQKMRDTQYEVIEAEPDIVHIKKQISDYKQTNSYYENKLDEFDRFIAELQTNIKQRKRYLADKKEQYRILYNEFGGSILKMKGSQMQLRGQVSKNITGAVNSNENRTLKDSHSFQQENAEHTFNKSIQSMPNNRQSLDNSRSKESIYTIIDNNSIQESGNAYKLPSLERNGANKKKQYVIMQKRYLQRHQRNICRLQKIIDSEQQYQSLSNSKIYNPQLKPQQFQLNYNSLKEVKQAIAQFDHTEALFRQCFERKKMSIQKSVSQLQSKLISNKELFLTACEVIGQKSGQLTFQDFCQLTIDEITTLFISFSWLNRKIYNQFSKKRKDLMNILKMIKNMEDQS